MKGGFVAVVAILAVVAALAVMRVEAVTCGQVDSELFHCRDYLTGREGFPPKACCDGVSEVKGLAVTPADKRAVCSCVKEAANRIADLKDAAAQTLAEKCEVQLDIPVSRTVDCNKYFISPLSLSHFFNNE